jgi:hypothetical protein
VPSLEEIEAAAQRFRVALKPLAVRTPQDIRNAFSALSQEHADALIVCDPDYVRPPCRDS